MISRTYRRRTTSLIVLLLVLTSSLFVAQPAPATEHGGLDIDRTLAQSNAEFVEGRFGLTALVEDGGVQLIPIGSLERMRTSSKKLCYPVAEMGTAAYETTVNGVKTTYFYLVGGRTNGPADDPTDPRELRSTCYGRIGSADGEMAAWQIDDSMLPPTDGMRENSAVAVRTKSGKAFLYSFGGAAGNLNLSIPDIYRAPINANGSIGAWTKLSTQMPGDTAELRPRHSFALVSFRADDGTTYIYIFGGRIRMQFGGRTLEGFFRDAWRTTVSNDGSLAAWTQLADMPLVDLDGEDCHGLRSSQAVTFPVYANSGDTSTAKQTVYIMGGRYQGDPERMCVIDTPSADVYRATLGQDGSLQWDSDPSQDPQSDTYNIYTVGIPIYGHKSVGFNQKIYILGGNITDATTSGPTRRVFSSIARSNQDLIEVPGGTNFLYNEDVLPQPLYAHGGEPGRYGNMRLFFIFGGRVPGKDIGQDYVDTVYYAIPALDEKGTYGFPQDGTYISPPIDLLAKGKPLQLRWTAAITQTTVDLQLAYRMADTEDGLYSKPWKIVDGDTSSTRWSKWQATGRIENRASINTTQMARWFQYRVIFTSEWVGGDPAKFTPVLKKVDLKYWVDSFPNLRVESATAEDMFLQEPSVTISNRAKPGEPPVVAAWIQEEGSFFVDLYLFAPGEQVVTPTLEADGSANAPGDVFAEINKRALDAGSTYTIPGNEFHPSNDPNSPVDWQALFNEKGTWNVIAMVDSTNLVPEDDTKTGPKERDNFLRFTVLVDDSTTAPPIILLPLVTKPSQ